MCVPKLRFPEFSEEWKEKKLDQLLSFKNGLNASKEKYGKGIKFINVSDILNNDFLTYENIDGSVEVSNEQFDNYTVTYGDVIFQRSSETREEVGTSNVYLDPEKDCIFGGFVIRGKKIAEYDPFFLKELLTTSSVRKEITSRSGGSTRYNIGQESLKIVKIKIPTIIEQEKTASFLSKVDEKIEKLEKKQELWEAYKKGIMQQIFSQKLRFKDENGEDYPDWEDKKFFEILFEHKTKSTGNEEVFSVSVHKGLINQVEHLGRTFAAPDTSKYNLVKPGDLIYTKSPTGDFPLGIIKQSKLNKNVIVSPLYGVFSPVNRDLGLILDSYFESPINTKNYLHPIVQKGAKNTMNITNNTFLSRSLILPIHEKEQSQIASFLSIIDYKIEMTNKELEKVEIFKKGLLQQMFC